MKLISKRVISTRNPLLGPKKIITKFGQNKWVSFVLGKVYENYPKVKAKCNFVKLTSKLVISTGNSLFSPKIR